MTEPRKEKDPALRWQVSATFIVSSPADIEQGSVEAAVSQALREAGVKGLISVYATLRGEA